MKPWQLPSGVQHGLPLIVQKDWTREQAVAVIELLDDLRELIYSHYQTQIFEFMHEQRRIDSDPPTTTTEHDEPF